MRPSQYHCQHGFTLLELIVTISVLSILVALAAPSFRQLLEAQRMRAASFDLVADLTLARSEAIKRGAAITLAPTTAGDWSTGWTVRAGAEEIGKKSPLGGGVTFAVAPNSIAFDRTGRVSSITTVRFGLQTSNALRQRCILLDPSGRPKSITTACPSP